MLTHNADLLTLQLHIGLRPGLAGFPSRRILRRDTTGNAAALTMNYSRHGTAKRCQVFGIELRKFFFTDVLNAFLHVFFGSGGLPEWPALTQRRPLVSHAGS